MKQANFRTIVGSLSMLLLASIATASAQEEDREALRALVPAPKRTLAPQIALTIGMAYMGARGYGFYWEGRKFSVEIAHLRQRADHAAPLQRVALYRQIGEMYRAQGETAKAQQNFATCITLSRRLQKQGIGSDRKGALTAEEALALAWTGETAAAETKVRSALAHTPRSWQVWAAAGQIRMDRARKMAAAAHSATSAPSMTARPPSVLTALSARSGGASGLPVTEAAAWKEARRDFDTAVRLAPDLPQPYEQRAVFLSAYAFAVHPSLTNSVAGLPDFERAVALRPQDPYALAVLAWLEYSDYGMRYYPGQSYDNFAVWKVLPPENRQRLRNIRRRIARLLTRRDPLLRAHAYAALSWLEYEFHDVPVLQAQTHLRQAMRAQPDLPEAEIYLMHTFAVEKQWEALARFCEERAQRHPQVRDHLRAAYAYYKSRQTVQAAEQVRAALRLQPDDPPSNLFLTFLALCTGGPADLETAGRCLETLDKTLATSAAADPAAQSAREETTILRGFYFALLGRREEAQQQLSQALKTDKDNGAVQQALTLLTQKP